MAEPSSATVGAVAAATGVITLTGSVVGLQYDALLMGMFGGLISLMHISVGPPLRMAGSLAAAAVVGALFSPVAVAAVHAYADWSLKVSPDLLRLASAGAIGLGAQVVIPLVLTWLGSFIKSRTPGGPA